LYEGLTALDAVEVCNHQSCLTCMVIMYKVLQGARELLPSVVHASCTPSSSSAHKMC